MYTHSGAEAEGSKRGTAQYHAYVYHAMFPLFDSSIPRRMLRVRGDDVLGHELSLLLTFCMGRTVQRKAEAGFR